MTRKRLTDIDIAVGISIILVVYGHLQFQLDLPKWYLHSRNFIYKFHMPLFMFFSGFIMSLSYYKIKNFIQYLDFMKKKINKFLPAYLFFSLTFLIYDTYQTGFDMNELKVNLMNILFIPSKAPAGFLWYVYILLQFYFILPILKIFTKKYWYLLIVFGFSLHFFDITYFFNLNLFCFYFIFIFLGILANSNIDKYYFFIEKFGLIFLTIFIALIFSYDLISSKLLLGLISIPAIHYISLKLKKLVISKQIAQVGKFTYYIYLMNTLVMGSLYTILISFFKFEINITILLLLFISGIFMPIYIYKKLISKIHILKRIIK